MLSVGSFYVVAIGSKYLRHGSGHGSCIVGQNIENAHQFPSSDQANLVADRIRGWEKKPLRVLHVQVQEVVTPPET